MIGCLLINPKFDFSSNKHDDKIVAHDYRQLGLCNHLDKNTGEKQSLLYHIYVYLPNTAVGYLFIHRQKRTKIIFRPFLV
ncbi:hypothetical protein [Moraxella catarrhalis]|nr:hypothetical protein [Moraxella catarrhalis]OBX42396.1 hypothetical protein A9Z59_03665 [Moraxella catarrhalis]